MPQIRHSIEVNVPLSAAYNQWTQFEDFPRFMEGVHQVQQTDDAHIHWLAERHGHDVEWDSEITDQIPDQLIAWRDTDGPRNHGSISFHPIKEGLTRIELTVDVSSESAPLSQVQTSHEDEMRERIGQDLHRFKQMIEKMIEMQGQESGSWRGEIHGARTSRPAQPEHYPDTPEKTKNKKQ